MFSLSGHHSLVPIGGIFLSIMGVAMIIGASFLHWRNRLILIGAAVACAAAVSSASHFIAPPAPTLTQLASFGLAIVMEGLAFAALMPIFYRQSDRAVSAGTLAIVGGHFMFMLPALGIWVILLSTLCVSNSALVWLVKRYPVTAAWFVDGAIKLAIGAAMISQAFGRK